MGKRIEQRLLDGETVELPNQGWRKGKFYDYLIDGEPMRIYVVEVNKGQAWIRLNQEPPLERLHRDSTKGYTAWDEIALGSRTSDTRTPDGGWQEPEPYSLYPDVQEAQTKAANEDWQEYRETVRPEEVAKEKSRRLVNKLRKLEREASKTGVDLTETLEDAVRRSRAQIVGERKRAA